MEPTKWPATRLKSAKYKIHGIKEQLFKRISYNKMNQYCGLSYDEALFLSYQKSSNKGKDCLLLFKGGWSLLIRRFSINLTLTSLFLVARIEKSSKSGA